MNLLKLMTVGCLLSCFSGLMTSCSDDDDAGIVTTGYCYGDSAKQGIS